MLEQMDRWIDASRLLQIRLYQAGIDPAVILTDDWRIDIATQLAIITDGGRRLRLLDPPQHLLPAHNELLLAAQHFNKMAELMVEGIDEIDLDKLEQAGKEMEEAAAHITESANKLPEP